ncbi:Hexosyltransferase, partial [Gryllus bimaculatus]
RLAAAAAAAQFKGRACAERAAAAVAAAAACAGAARGGRWRWRVPAPAPGSSSSWPTLGYRTRAPCPGRAPQGDWAEGYRLLLRKHLLALRWLVRCCARAHLLLKMDDDVAADVPWLLEHARRRLRGREGQAVLLGHVLAGAAPQRAPGDKWRLSREEFAADAFPRFVSGWAYVATAAAASALLRIVDSAARPAPLWIDDVYITGVRTPTAPHSASVQVNAASFTIIALKGNIKVILESLLKQP